MAGAELPKVVRHPLHRALSRAAFTAGNNMATSTPYDRDHDQQLDERERAFGLVP